MLACTWLQETDKIPFHLERQQQTYPDAVNARRTDIKCDILCCSLFFPAPGEACWGVGDPPGVSGCGAGSQEPGHVVLSDFAVGEHRTSHQQLSGHHQQAADRGSKHKKCRRGNMESRKYLNSSENIHTYFSQRCICSVWNWLTWKSLVLFVFNDMKFIWFYFMAFTEWLRQFLGSELFPRNKPERSAGTVQNAGEGKTGAPCNGPPRRYLQRKRRCSWHDRNLWRNLGT